MGHPELPCCVTDVSVPRIQRWLRRGNQQRFKERTSGPWPGITSHARALVIAIVVVTGPAILHCGAATADPNQDEHFLQLLNQEDIPALANVPSLIATAHQICRKLDGGMTANALVDDMRNSSFTDPTGQQFPARRITTTITRFITAAVDAYCPDQQAR